MMLKRLFFIFAVVAGLILLPRCAYKRNDITPAPNRVYKALTLKVNVKAANSRQKQNFKIVLKYDDIQDKMLFLSPLNQVMGRLFLKKERVLLVNSKGKKYWRGTFQQLIDRIWGLNFTYAEFKDLVITGKLPEKRLKHSGLNITRENEKNSQRPRRIKIVRNGVTVKLKISNRKSGHGAIDFSPRLEGLKRASIDDVLTK